MSKEMWVVDFGGLKDVKEWLDYMFDHTFLVSENDPELELFREMNKRGIIQLRIMPNVGMEGTAKFVYEKIDKMIKEVTENRAYVSCVEVRENVKNSAIYKPKLKN